MTKDEVVVAVTTVEAADGGKFAFIPIQLLAGQLHVYHGIGQAVFVAERHNSVVQALHDAPLSNIKLVV